MMRSWRDRPLGPVSSEEAEAIAVAALGFLAAEPSRVARFLALTGVEPAELLAGAGRPAMQASILEHLLGDESLLLAFATHAGVAPGRIEPARRCLQGSRRDGG
jgi:hypothetical protein